MKQYKRIDPLGPNHKIVVSNDHTFGTDAVLLADFANVKPKDKAIDLGTGCGIIPLLWCKGKTNEVFAVEIREKACEQTKRSIELNGFEKRITLVQSDLRDLKGKVPFGHFNVVSMNPPYKPVGTGIESESSADKIARHETMCSMDELALCASKLLRFGGRLCLCHRPERIADIICSLRANNIETKRIRFVSKTATSKPWLVLVEGRLGGKSGVTVEETLIMYKEGSNSELSDEVKSIFGDYYNEKK